MYYQGNRVIDYITVTPAKAGVHAAKYERFESMTNGFGHWIPAQAGITRMVRLPWMYY